MTGEVFPKPMTIQPETLERRKQILARLPQAPATTLGNFFPRVIPPPPLRGIGSVIFHLGISPTGFRENFCRAPVVRAIHLPYAQRVPLLRRHVVYLGNGDALLPELR